MKPLVKVAVLMEADTHTNLTEMVETLIALDNEGTLGSLATEKDLRGMLSLGGLLTEKQKATFERHPEIDAWLMTEDEIKPLADKKAVLKAVLSLAR